MVLVVILCTFPSFQGKKGLLHDNVGRNQQEIRYNQVPLLFIGPENHVSLVHLYFLTDVALVGYTSVKGIRGSSSSIHDRVK